MMDKEEYDKAFYAFYEAVINERHWDSLRLPRDIESFTAFALMRPSPAA